MGELLSMTESVCPECLQRIPAMRVLRGKDVYLDKDCPDHGHYSTIIWRGQPSIKKWVHPKTPSFPEQPFTEVNQGCPYDCGLCPEHRQHTCSVLLEVTQRCDLGCPICFADSNEKTTADLSRDDIEAWYNQLQLLGGPYNIQLSGGEPCLRDDLPEIIRMGHDKGFNYIQVNTNGLRIARDLEYLKKLKAAGLSAVFLQFDGVSGEVYCKIRGRDLLEEKMAAIQQCISQKIGVVLVPTLVPGINTGEIGDIVKLALSYLPVVRGVHFQPISYFGRYPQSPGNELRITLPEVIQEIENQTQGMIQKDTLCPPGCENALCSFHGNYVLMPDGELKPLTRQKQETCCCRLPAAAEGAEKARRFVAKNWQSPEEKPEERNLGSGSLGEWDAFLERKMTHTLCLSGMAFQDAWTLDLERLRDCCIHVASPNGRLVPFCAYNLTDRQGRSLYRDVIKS